MNIIECQIWVTVDEIGDYVASHNQGALNELWESDIGDVDCGKARRLVQITVQIPLPRPAVATVVVPDLPNDAIATVS